MGPQPKNKKKLWVDEVTAQVDHQQASHPNDESIHAD